MYRNCKMNIKKGDKKVVLELLSSCNLNCSHCFYRVSDKFHSSDFLSKKEIFKLVDKMKKNNVNKLVFTGGEPTLHPDFVEISRYAMTKIPKVTICTNGVILNDKLENEIIELGFDTYTVSIDSHLKMVHNKFRGRKKAFERTVAFAKKLKINGRNVSIHIAIHLNNIDHIEKTIEFCKKFSNEIVVSSIYYDKIKIPLDKRKKYKEHTESFKEKYLDDSKIILVGFEPFCNNENCLDQKNIFMVDRKGRLINCYWGKNGGKVVRKY